MSRTAEARTRGGLLAALLTTVAAGCAADPSAPAEAEAEPAAAGVSESASAEVVAASARVPEPEVPFLGIRGYATLVYEKPSESSAKLGYLRVGEKVPRSAEPVGKGGCKGGWYAIQPRGYVCAGKEATIDLDDPLLRAAAKRPERDKPLPYRYGFVRAVLPLYLQVPTSEQQFKSEFKLEDHLAWFKEHKAEVQTAGLGAADLPVDAHGRVVAGKRLGELGLEKNSTELGLGQLFGGHGDDDPWPFWLREGERLIPNISGFDVPDYAVFADRARRHTGLAFIGSFDTDDIYLRRRFAITTDLRLAPTSKVKPDAASPWHGYELGGAHEPPLGIVRRRGAQAYEIKADTVTPVGDLERRTIHKLTGKVKKVEGERYLQLEGGRWAQAEYLGVVVVPRTWPSPAKKGEKWIEVDLSDQILVLWNGKTPEFATLVSTGRPAIGDPDTTTATPRGSFRIFAKHISATMDSDEGASERTGRKPSADAKESADDEEGPAPGEPGYVPKKGDGKYGVTLRRGHGLFKLRDVPYIQYFEGNYAIHGAYWHDVFGIARSHGCINLSPADALRVFKFTEPQVPDAWHGVRFSNGTAVIIHK